MKSRKARRVGLAVSMSVATVAAAVALIAPLGATASQSHTAAAPLKIALSNSFVGNQWRIEMENVFKAGCAMPPFKGSVTCTVFNAGNNDVATQIQQITDLIAQHVNAIVVDAASPTGLNGIIQQACNKGIEVVSFDNTVSNKCGYQVSISQAQFGTVTAQFIANQLHGKGNVMVVTGVAGTQADTDRNAAVLAVFKKYPGIKVVSKFSGQWNSAIAQRATATALASLPKVDGVWVSGGTDGVLKAFVQAKRPLPVTGGEGENGFRKFMLGYEGQKPVDGESSGTPPFLGLAALGFARETLLGKYPKKNVLLPAPVVTTQTVKSGITVFPNLPDSFYATFTDSGPKATLQICVNAALHGTACPGSLTVRLP